MTRRTVYLLALVLAAAASCAKPRDEGQNAGSRSDELVTDDQVVIDAALSDFAAWKEATFGNRKGFLALDAISTDLTYRTLPDTRQLIARISDAVSDELIVAFLERNKVKTNIAPLVAKSPWARIETPADESDFLREVPEEAKALGSISMPGFSADRTRALIQINHSWSIHGAVVTYVLSKQDGTWKFQARDQVVFL